MGEMTKEATFEMLDYFFENGGNFIDTASNYQQEESETWIGEWVQQRGNRDQLVLATKYTTFYPADPTAITIPSNYSGNDAKNLHISVKDSLKKLQTDYIDLVRTHYLRTSGSSMEKRSLCIALPPLVGFLDLHPRDYAVSEPPSRFRKGPLPWC